MFSRMGQDEREGLEYVPSSFKVIRHVPAQAELPGVRDVRPRAMPALPIERGRPEPGLIAHVLVSKYCDHLPLHRQTVIYDRKGVELDRSTLADWIGQATFPAANASRFGELSPLAEAICRYIRAGAAARRRHHRAGARPGPRQDQHRTALGRVRDERP